MTSLATATPRNVGGAHGMSASEKSVMDRVDRGESPADISAALGFKPYYVAAIIKRFSGDDLGKAADKRAKDGSTALLAALFRMVA